VIEVETPAALEDLYREHRLALCRLAYLLTGSREHAEDIVQSAFTSAYTHRGGITAPLPYLRRAVVNLAQDGHRRRYRERRRLPAAGTTEIPEVDEAWAHIQRLPDRQRAVIVLRFYEDLALVDIARLLDRRPATVRSDLKRALDRLRKVLG
jgi:RNA polymerase sigma factor (sigma-70 family)